MALMEKSQRAVGKEITRKRRLEKTNPIGNYRRDAEVTENGTEIEILSPRSLRLCGEPVEKTNPIYRNAW
jgi:hypothetical protein